MAIEIATGFDTAVTETADLTRTDAEFANRVITVLEKLKSGAGGNSLGTAALADTGTTAGDVPALNASGLIANSLINSTATGGAAGDSGKLVALNASGLIASTMLSGGSGGGGGIKGLWFYNGQQGPGTTVRNGSNSKQWLFTDEDTRWNKPTDVNAILVFCTGAGGAGSYGPPTTTTLNPDGTNNSISGRFARKGGGGAGGSTAIVYVPSPSASYEIRIGRGGPARDSTDSQRDSSSKYGGGTSQVGSQIAAQGGNPGNSNGNGGTPRPATPGNLDNGEGILGGQGHDGDESVWGGGSGGSSFWGGAYSGGGGVGVPTDGVNSAPGGGGGAAHGTNQARQFSGGARGHAGNDGCVMIIGFG